MKASPVLRSAAFAALVFYAAAAHAVTFEKIAATGEAAPGGSGAVFRSFGVPVINAAGDVAFPARLSAGTGPAVTTQNDAGLYRRLMNASLEQVVRSGQTAPSMQGSGLLFGSFPRLVLDASGNVVFQAALAIDNSKVYSYNDSGIWTNGSTPGQLFLVAQENDRASIAYNGALIPWGQDPPLFDRIDAPTVSAEGTITFRANLKSYPTTTYNGRAGAWQRVRPDTAVSATVPALVTWSNEVAPGTPNNFSSFTTPALLPGGAFVFQGSSLTQEGIWSGPPGGFSLTTAAGLSAPELGNGPMFFDFGTVSANSQGQLAFWGGATDAAHAEGIWTRRLATTSLLALAGSPASGFSQAVFDYFLDPVLNDQGEVAVLGYCKSLTSTPLPAGKEHGIWRGSARRELRLIALAGSPAPGAGGAVFRRLSSPLLNGHGDLVFTAEVAPADDFDNPVAGRVGVWVAGDFGAAQMIALEGTPLSAVPGLDGTVASLAVGGWSESGELALTAGFAGGAEAVVKVAALALPNLLPDKVAGTYKGVIQLPIPTPDRQGTITVTVGRTGALTANVTFGAAVFTVRGTFVPHQTFTKSVTLRGKTYTLNLDVDVSGLDRVTGTLQDASGTVLIEATRSVFVARTNPAPQAGAYTFFLRLDPAATGLPQGGGFGRLTVTTAGLATAVGTLPDGTKFSQGKSLSKSGVMALSLLLQAKKGLLAGDLVVDTSAPADISGTPLWLRAPDTRFPAFTAYVGLSGSKYSWKAGQPVLTLATGLENALASLSGGNVVPFRRKLTVLPTTNKVTIAEASPEHLKVTLTPSTGLFSGSLLHPATKRTVFFYGAVDQQLSSGLGIFIGPAQTGAIELTPR